MTAVCAFLGSLVPAAILRSVRLEWFRCRWLLPFGLKSGFVVLLPLVQSPLPHCSSCLDLVGALALPALFFVAYFLLIWCLFLMLRVLYLGGLLAGCLARAELLLQVIRCVLFPLFNSRV